MKRENKKRVKKWNNDYVTLVVYNNLIKKEKQHDLLPAKNAEDHEGPFDMSAKPHNHWRDFIPKAQIGNLSLT